MTAAPGSRMLAEAAEAPGVIAAQFVRNAGRMRETVEWLRDVRPRAVVTCARGSSDHAATYARYLFETRLGLLCSSASPSVSSVYGVRADLAGTLLLAISQSGASPDLLATVAAARATGARVLAMVNVEDSPLARSADVVLPLGAGLELSVAATKSYLATLAAILHLCAEWAGDANLVRARAEAPDHMRRAWLRDWTPALEVLREAKSCFVIGRGLGLGIAQEWALKLKETCRLHAEAYSAAEVRHGPMAMVRPGFPVLVLAQHDETHAGTCGLATEFAAHAAPTLLAGGSAAGATELATESSDPAVEPLLATQSFYRMAEALARVRGLDPDRPAHLQKVTATL
jgi:glucosamine--fructose-6-phosphate aminotransferase (isomerizing)